MPRRDSAHRLWTEHTQPCACGPANCQNLAAVLCLALLSPSTSLLNLTCVQGGRLRGPSRDTEVAAAEDVVAMWREHGFTADDVPAEFYPGGVATRSGMTRHLSFLLLCIEALCPRAPRMTPGTRAAAVWPR